MQLIGMLDSPYVRRVAVAMIAAGVRFEHKPISLFRHIEAFTALSPLLKAPSLLTEEGVVLVDSSVILDYLATRSPALDAMRPASAADFRRLGVALTVMEKAVQFHYERALRGPGEQSESWRARVTRQLLLGLQALDAETPGEPALTHADIATASAFGFVVGTVGDAIETAGYARLAGFSARAEALPAFQAAPALDGATARG
jgi:glutathione S-transferase